ncbi:hypothetical protein [Lacrimispora sp.]|uniref:hypothetical protein n=1 Tax=Lacrimispora sp. TaxID=2719234 RepID=UPI0028AA874F|nr:hypothetical protein [Lacrimispora sp.]
MEEYYHGTGKINQKVIEEIKDYLYPNVYRIIVIVCNIMFAIIGLLFMLVGAFTSAAITASGIVILCVISICLKGSIARKFMSGLKEMGISELVYDMTFYENTLSIKNLSAENAINLEYRNINRIIETDSMLFFLTKSSLPFPLMKDCLVNDKKYELLSLLKEKNPKIKFIGIL